MSRRFGAGRGRFASAAGTVLAVCGIAMIGVALAGQEAVPTTIPNAAEGQRLATATDPAASEEVAETTRPRDAGRRRGTAMVTSVDRLLLPDSRPVSLRVPSIGVTSETLVPLGLQSDGALEVPQDPDLAGWYQHGPTPGELGPAVLVGHVDSAEDGPAVFFDLTELGRGDQVLVDRADGSTAVFRVRDVAQYPKNDFPTLDVYGGTDRAELRLITCGGAFDSDGHYRDNVVVYAQLTDVR